jgi:hypothetical protein
MGKLTCQDLMVGDWFKSVDYNSPFRITAIYDDVVQTQADYQSEIDGNWYSEVEIKDLVPIKLTEEILVKNGFEYAYNEVSKMQNKQLLVDNIGGHYIEIRLDKRNMAVWYDYDEDGDGVYSDVLIDLPYYVHKLQHLLRLCGIEKEIEL